MLQAIKAWLTDFKAGYAYVRDPHGWEQKRRVLLHLKYKPRPAIMPTGVDGKFRIHPDLAKRLDSTMSSWFRGRMVVTPLAVEYPPEDGWPDIQVPERPRLAS